MKMNTLLNIPVVFGLSIEVYLILVILGIPTFFLWRRVFNKYIKFEQTRKLATWAATILATPLIYVGIATLLFFGITYYPKHTFTKEKSASDIEKRYEISQDIITRQLLIGKTKAEVRELLGIDGNIDSSDYWTYDVGFVPALFGIDPDVLAITFKNGKVILVEQHQT